MKKSDSSPPQGNDIVFWRGMRARCPNCGKGNLFTSYLTPSAACSVCGEDLSGFHVDDGASWVAMLLVGFITVPAGIYLSMQGILPQGLAFLLLLAVLILAVFLLLPRVKGVFIAMLWWISRKNS
jgi:uncharacterized protein (DUF983 family)